MFDENIYGIFLSMCHGENFSKQVGDEKEWRSMLKSWNLYYHSIGWPQEKEKKEIYEEQFKCVKLNVEKAFEFLISDLPDKFLNTKCKFNDLLQKVLDCDDHISLHIYMNSAIRLIKSL
jgi:hypothetical protein